ncbi:DUF2252 family protein [Roseibium porphyridii]|uniref:DUF2252 family protein n=1 Tax=Roseibium porphyridii TaxID=2866279 RepID=A0ABY8F2C2_9HYPH|nr:DUF2252 family protein [Roseibium sp. KMA01]WFE89632.1 DUF2252 family protein [Roseibium sp. KMA01]
MNARRKRQLLISQELQRIDGAAPDARPVLAKHIKMAASPFQFLRGASQLFYADLSVGTFSLPSVLLEVPLTRIVGDCHLANFGFLTENGSYGDTVIWAPNDYDDAAAGHAAFDLMRFCVSLFLVADFLEGLVAGRYRNEKKFKNTTHPTRKDAEGASKRFLKSYRKTLGQIVKDTDKRDEALKRFTSGHFLRKPIQKAQARSAGGKHFKKKSSVAKLTRRTAAGFRFDPSSDKLAKVSPDLAGELRQVFGPHFDDDVLDVARRIGAGTGSLSVERYYFLVGPDAAPDAETFRETHVVEVKQQREAAVIHHFPDLSPVNRMNPAHLTVDCQRRMMRRPDLVLDEVVWSGLHWLVRSRHHARLTVDTEDLLRTGKPAKALKDYAEACGVTLARTHSRGDRRSVRFERAMASALKATRKDLIAIARRYAAQTRRDHALLLKMIGADGDAHAA